MHFRENWLILWGIRGELILGILGVKAKYFQGADDFFRDLGKSMLYFWEHRPRGLTDNRNPDPH